MLNSINKIIIDSIAIIIDLNNFVNYILLNIYNKIEK